MPTDVRTDHFGSTISPLSILTEIAEANLIKELEDNYKINTLKGFYEDKKTKCVTLHNMLFKSQSGIVKAF